METGLVFNIQRYSIHDGPGIRTTVFLKGCPLTCWWCHNPESQAPEREVIVLEGRCVRCGECRRACPQTRVALRHGPSTQACPPGGGTPGRTGIGAAHSPEDAAGSGPDARHRADACTLCGACVEACPTGARQMVGRPMGVGDVMAEVLKDRPFYEESGGGVTFSGGEPLLQPRFLRSLLDACRKAAVHTAVDTCGYAAWQDLLGLAALTDLFLYDLKMMDDRRHRQYTGASNGPILENLRALGRVHRNIWIRIPIIPGLSDGPEDLEAAARFAASIPGVQQVNLLPHHETGSAKFSRLGRPYRLEGTESPSSEQMAEAAEKFRTFGLNVKIGG